MKTLGIAAHSAEGATLCFITACRHGGELLGEFDHPRIVMSAVPLAPSMPGWDNDDHGLVAKYLAEGVEIVARAGADFFVMPDNTAHIVLEKIIDDLPIPGLHIAHVVCREIEENGWKRVGLLGTNWTMVGPVYENALKQRGLERLIPDESRRERLHAGIFDELCNGIFTEATTRAFIEAIDELKSRGAECVILGCTEIPLIITAENSALPILDSTRLLAKRAVGEAVSDRALRGRGWIDVSATS